MTYIEHKIIVVPLEQLKFGQMFAAAEVPPVFEVFLFERRLENCLQRLYTAFSATCWCRYIITIGKIVLQTKINHRINRMILSLYYTLVYKNLV
jgi:hypothetical protein